MENDLREGKPLKKLLKPQLLPLVTAALGGLALVLRRLLYRFGTDARGLLVNNHPLSIALWALTALAAVYLFAGVRNLDGSEEYEDNFRKSPSAALGHVLAAAGIAFTVLTEEPRMANYLGQGWQLLGSLAPLCLLLAGAARLLGKKPFFLLHLIPSLFLVFHIINHYQMFSGNPQFQDYLFTLLGTMALMFFAFYSASFDVGLGNRRLHMGMGLAAIYLCLAELAASMYPVLYLGGIAWALTGQCSPYPVPKQHQEEQ